MRKIVSLFVLIFGLYSWGEDSTPKLGPVLYGQIVESSVGVGRYTLMNIDELADSAGGSNPWKLYDQIASQWDSMGKILREALSSKVSKGILTPEQIATVRSQAQKIETEITTLQNMLNHANVTAWLRAVPLQPVEFIDTQLSLINMAALRQGTIPLCDMQEHLLKSITPEEAQQQSDAVKSAMAALQANDTARRNQLAKYLSQK